MFGNALPGLLHMLSITVAWILVVSSVSTMYRVTVERFDHSEWWNDHNRFALETHSRRL